jgi:hypothetical protein
MVAMELFASNGGDSTLEFTLIRFGFTLCYIIFSYL